MSDIKFLFGLDNVILKGELITELSRHLGLAGEIQMIRRQFPDDKFPFSMGYMKYIEKFADVPLSEIRRIIRHLEWNDSIFRFITNNRERCFIITDHLNIWTNELLEKIGTNYYTSEASESNGLLEKISYVMDRTALLRSLSGTFAAVGNNTNDVAMLSKSKIAIGYGGTKDISPSVLNYATHAVFDEQCLTYFLNQLL